jgi:hypothetical protein
MGWEKNEVQIADLEKYRENDCEVCEMLIKGLTSYRDMTSPHMPLPLSISVKCVPGRSFIVKRPVKKASYSNNRDSKLLVNSASKGNDSAVQDQATQDILGPEGLEFFITPGEITPFTCSKCYSYRLTARRSRNVRHTYAYRNWSAGQPRALRRPLCRACAPVDYRMPRTSSWVQTATLKSFAHATD